jgi:hypothetical protein
VGLSYVSANFPVGAANVTYSKVGWGFLVGLGYDVRIARNVSITPCFNYNYGKPGDVDLVAGLVTVPGVKFNVLDFALGITFH